MERLRTGVECDVQYLDLGCTQEVQFATVAQAAKCFGTPLDHSPQFANHWGGPEVKMQCVKFYF